MILKRSNWKIAATLVGLLLAGTVAANAPRPAAAADDAKKKAAAREPVHGVVFEVAIESNAKELETHLRILLPRLAIRQVGTKVYATGAEDEVTAAVKLAAGTGFLKPEKPKPKHSVLYALQFLSAADAKRLVAEAVPGVDVGGGGAPPPPARVDQDHPFIRPLGNTSAPLGSEQDGALDASRRLQQIIQAAPTLVKRPTLADLDVRPLQLERLPSNTGVEGADGNIVLEIPFKKAPSGKYDLSAKTSDEVLSNYKAYLRNKRIPLTGELVMLSGTPDEVVATLQLLSKADVAPPQVVVEVRMLEFSPEDVERLGVQWADRDGFLTGSTISETRPSGMMRFGRFSRTGLDFEAAVSALHSKGKARLLANPSITVVEGKEAKIFIGDQVKFLSTQSVNAQGQVTLQTVVEDIGINLLVSAAVHDNEDAVTLALHPNVSTLVSFIQAPGGGVLPRVRTREANTSVRLQNGEMIAIGGLLNTEDLDVVERIPLLGRLPVLGELFRNRRRDRRRTELTIFLRPRIVRNSDTLPQPIVSDGQLAPNVRNFSVGLSEERPAKDKPLTNQLAVTGGTTAWGRIKLEEGAPSNGLSVVLRTTNGTAVDAVEVPAFVELTQGRNEADFRIVTGEVKQNTVVEIIATAGGVERKATLTLLPRVFGVGLAEEDPKLGAPAPGRFTGRAGKSYFGQITFGKPAYIDTTLRLRLSSGQEDVVPATLFIPKGCRMASFPIDAEGVFEGLQIIVATTDGVERRATLSLVPPDEGEQ